MSPTVMKFGKLIRVYVLQLPPEIDDSEIALLAPKFSPNTLETLALQFFEISEARVKTLKADNINNTEGFKRDLLTYYRNRGHGRKVKELKRKMKVFSSFHSRES